MLAKKFLLLITLLFLFCNFASANVFTVTSNADSGTGTLREALTLAAANGSAVKDYIYFNIADVSVAGRTITLLSKLPAVSSNLVIDGSTQAGAKLGPGDARVSIKANRASFSGEIGGYIAAFLIYQQSDVEIYGFEISEFYYLGYLSSNLGIIIADSQNIQIGAPGKGNWIHNCNTLIFGQAVYGEFTNENNAHITIQSNYLGFEVTDLSYVGEGLTLTAKNITIGGATDPEGNHIATSVKLYGDHLKISHNNIGIDGNGDLSKYYFLTMECASADDVEISYNIAPLFSCFLNRVTNFKIYANKDIALNFPQSGTRAVIMTDCSDGIIGSEDESLENVFFTNTGSGPDYITSTITNTASNNIQVLKNKIICSRRAYSIYPGSGTNIIIPDIQVLVNNSTEYSGTASPNSDIYIYYDDSDCPVCSPLNFFTKIQANANGQWKITGNFTNKKWVSNALRLKNSSEFTQPYLSEYDDYYSTSMPTCGRDNGSIAMINTRYKNILKFEWYNSNNEKIGEGPFIEHLKPGTYYAKGFNGLCFAKTVDIILYDIHPVIFDAAKKVVNPSCGIGGSITGILVSTGSQNTASYKWTEKTAGPVGSTLDIENLPAGEYTLTVKDDVTGCELPYGPITLINAAGPAINQSNPIKTPSSCTVANGSIHGITATGTHVKYSWKNEQNVEVGTNADLDGQPAGKYILTVTDDSNCGPVTSAAIEILSINGITINDAGRVISKATCQYDNGGISNIQVTGATTYTWYNESDVSVSNNLILTGMSTGNYYLIAANDNGCSKQTAVYTITREPPVSYGTGLTKILKNATCDENNGSIEVIFQGASNTLPESYKWVNTATGQVVNTLTPILTGIDAGSYDIYGIVNGCEQYLINYSIGRNPGLTVVTNKVQVNDDHCSAGVGSITGVHATGTNPLNFTWTDDNNVNKGALPDLINVPAGTYHLKIIDGSNCEQSFVYTIYDQSDAIPLPNVSDVQLCSPGTASLSVSNTNSKYSYRLYDDNNSAAPVDEQQNGRFNIHVNANRSYYISQYFGHCESARAEVKVALGSITGGIANTFTPNSDGINDYWKITGMENYTNGTVKVFNRDGKMVFQSKGYTVPFDGTFGGKPLPAGVYYYIIDLKSCNLISGNLTLLR